MNQSKEPNDRNHALARRLGLFDITMLVMGGIIGSGIFINPYVVAQQVSSSWLILSAWAFGGLIALAVTFARYVCALGNLEANDTLAALLATIVLVVLTIINCLGVRAGSTTQN